MSFRSTSRAASLDEHRTRLDGLDPTTPLAIAAIDIDGFDLINDQEGFEAGDQVLHLVEDALLGGLPGGALLGHAKGDEWYVALPDATSEELLVVLDGIRRELAAGGRVTIAGGV